MKRVVLFIFSIAVIWTFAPVFTVAQDDDCCPEEDKYGREDELLINEWQKQMYDFSAKREQLMLLLQKSNSEIDALKKESSDRDNKIAEAENQLYSSVGTDRNGVADFRKKFDETEKKINNKLGTPSEARKSYFNEIEASKIKCLPEFFNRYLAMKNKLEAWEKEPTGVVKSNQYTVVKGDCLWKIAGMKDIYGKNNYWPKIWEANEKGVISAPPNTPKTIVNPNLIYPGQVLKIPVLTDEDLKSLKDLKYQVKMQKQAEDMKMKKNNSTLKKKDIKKELKNIKKEVKNDTKKNVKKDSKKDEKKEVKKDIKK